MLKILGVLFIVLGLILNTYSIYAFKNAKNLNKTKKEELDKLKKNGTTFIFAGVSALVLGLIL
ncbi:hypothetical protein [Romboutsia lituseburensis]|uniref:hypothetical protein n=1 Tax=Romboutsia lituseburensis TaxID=1537 RepID=UPI00215AD10F|nr:hypothetical protein [Romboutsia lituseburensis]MCR8744131.1 hypothetical protein [Romboutsia lituseburensis]